VDQITNDVYDDLDASFVTFRTNRHYLFINRPSGFAATGDTVLPSITGTMFSGRQLEPKRIQTNLPAHQCKYVYVIRRSTTISISLLFLMKMALITVMVSLPPNGQGSIRFTGSAVILHNPT
jgi:hypothetical protein